MKKQWLRLASVSKALLKLRRLLGDADSHTLIAEGHAIALRTAGVFIDALEVSWGPVREPDAGNLPVRFDERGVETELRLSH